MVDGLIALLVTALILCIVLGVLYAIVKFIASKFSTFGEVAMYIFYGLAAILVILYILVPLLHMLPAVHG